MDGLFNPQALRLVLKEWPLEDESIETHDDRSYVEKEGGDHLEDEILGPHYQNRADIITNLRYTPISIAATNQPPNRWCAARARGIEVVLSQHGTALLRLVQSTDPAEIV
jgi:hypothetical protein